MPTTRKTTAPAAPPALPPNANAAPPPKLPGNVTAAAVLLLIFGTLAGIGTAMSLLATLAFSVRRFGFDDGFGRFDGGGMFMGFTPVLVTLVLGAAISSGHLAAGIGILQRQPWGRILGMVVSGAALVVVSLSLAASVIWIVVLPDFSNVGDGRMWIDWIRALMTWTVAVGVVVGVLLIAAYGFVLWVLARADETSD